MSRNDEFVWRVYNESLYLNDSEFNLFVDELHKSNMPVNVLEKLIKNAAVKRLKIADKSNGF